MSSLCTCGKASKYCCPRCEVRTCSLECSKNHKIKLSCNGLADKTQFVKLSEFDNLKLVSDYKFLEQIKESIESSHRHLADSLCSSGIAWAIKKQCIANNTLLKFMPNVFTRNQTNKSYFKDGKIFWTVELVFTDCSVKVLGADICETYTINDIIAKYSTISAQHSEYRFISNFYKDNEGISYYIKADVGDNDHDSFHQLDPNIPLNESLKFKTVIEFPTIFIANKGSHFKTIECKEYDVKEEMKRLGIFTEGKRKRNSRRRGWKQKRGKYNKSALADNNGNCDENDNAKTNSDPGAVTGKSNPFKDSVLKLFCDDSENNNESQDHEETAPKKDSPVTEAEEGEISE